MKNQLQKRVSSAVTTAVTPRDFEDRSVRTHPDDGGKRLVALNPETDPLLVTLEVMRCWRLNELELFRRHEVLVQRVEEIEKKADIAMALSQSGQSEYSLIDWTRLCDIPLDLVTAARMAEMLNGICEQREIATGRAWNAGFGSVRTYPESILREFFGNVLNGEVNL